ncbi:MAG TPA: hypothetical protein DCG28_04220 [Lachnospiraceae bacterium]|nr:hypothetical protein [Lachnospiraceae bacterium]
MKRKFLAFAAVFVLISGRSVFAESVFDGMTDEEKTQAAGVYLQEIIKYVNENYVGEPVDIETLVNGAVNGITQQLDSYSAYLPQKDYDDIKAAEKAEWFSPDFSCSFNEDGYPVIVAIEKGSKNYGQGIRKGDTIQKINGLSAYGIGQEEYESLVNVDKDGKVTMTIARGYSGLTYNLLLTQKKKASVTVRAISEFNTDKYTYSSKKIGYIKISSFSSDTANEFSKAIATLKQQGITSVILDLRGNTGGYVDEAIAVARLIVPMGKIITTKDKAGKTVEYTSNLQKPPFDYCAVLVDGMTASASEIVASALQDSKAAKIVGEQTFGKGVMQSVMEFEGLGVVKMTTLEYTSRSGKTINGVGITPDIGVDKILFLDENEPVTDDKVTAALKYIGFKVDKENTNERNIGRFQVEEGLPVTYKLDAKTVNAINLEIYSELLQSDRILTAGYMYLLGETE